MATMLLFCDLGCCEQMTDIRRDQLIYLFTLRLTLQVQLYRVIHE